MTVPYQLLTQTSDFEFQARWLEALNEYQESKIMMIAWSLWEDDRGEVFCCECGQYLNFSPLYCAHIISKGSNTALRKLVINMVPLCFECHSHFDGGYSRFRKNMRIWNLFILERIQHLKLFYKYWANDHIPE